MAKVNVSIPDELLADVDEIAREFHRSRSGLVQEATAAYVARVRTEQAEAMRRSEVREAFAGMRALAKEIGPFPDSTEAIRRDRDSDHGRIKLDD